MRSHSIQHDVTALFSYNYMKVLCKPHTNIFYTYHGALLLGNSHSWCIPFQASSRLSSLQYERVQEAGAVP